MHNEVSTSPTRSSSFCPYLYHNNKGNKHQKDTRTSLTKVDQDIPKGKKGNKDDMLGQKANKQKPKQTEVEMQPAVGCKIRILVG